VTLPKTRNKALSMLGPALFLAAALACLAGVAFSSPEVPLLGPLALCLPLACLAAWLVAPPKLAAGQGRGLASLALGALLLGLGQALLWQRLAPEHEPALGLGLMGLGCLALLLPLAWHRPEAAAREKPLPLRLELLLLLAALLLGAAFRFWRLGQVPAGIWYDEAALGEQVMGLLEGGRAELWFGGTVQHPGLWFWAVAPWFKALGPGILTLRLFSAFHGMLALLAFYFLARQWLKPRLALALLAGYAMLRWGFNFDRLGFMAPFAGFWTLLALAFMVRAQRTRAWADFIAAGLCLGAMLQAYIAVRLAVPAMVLWVALANLLDRPGRRWAQALGWLLLAAAALAFWQGAAHGPQPRLFALALALLPLGAAALAWGAGASLAGWVMGAFLGALPVLWVAAWRWGDFALRADEVSVAHDVASQGLPVLAQTLSKHLLMFNWLGDYNGRHNLHNMPLFDTLAGALFLPALLLAHWRAWRDRRALLLVLLFWCVLAGGVFSVAVEAPQAHRTFLLAPIAALMMGLLLEALAQRLRLSFSPRLPRALLAALLSLLAVLALFNAHEYFGLWAASPDTYESFSPVATAIARRAEAQDRGWLLAVTGLEHDYRFYGYEVAQLCRTLLKAEGREASSLLASNHYGAMEMQAHPQGVLLIWGDSDKAGLGQAARAEFPDLPVEEQHHPFTGVTLYQAMAVPWPRIPAVGPEGARGLLLSREPPPITERP
jgi:4-amino-4-deoxy-L-arabinose transferase-like glycosyltransferase